MGTQYSSMDAYQVGGYVDYFNNSDMATQHSLMDAYQVGGYVDYINNSEMATHHSLMDAYQVGGYVDYINNSEMATHHSLMDAYQGGGYVDFNNSDMATRHSSRNAFRVNYQDSGMWRRPVSFSVEKESEPKYWDGGKCEVVGEGTFEAASDHDLELAMALSEQGPHMGDELTRRLSHFNSIPHVPRVNSDIPPGDPWVDKQRLLDRIEYYGLAERQVDGDGNCQFRALSDQLYRTPDHHMFVRAQVVSQLAEAPDSYSSHVPMEYNQYLENMARDGEWGDHVTLQAAADFYGVKISLITSFKDSCFTEIIPAQQKSEKGLFLSFWSELHYNSIYPLEESVDSMKKKKWFSSD